MEEEILKGISDLFWYPTESEVWFFWIPLVAGVVLWPVAKFIEVGG